MTVRDWVMLTIVELADEFEMPSPVQPVKEYPVAGVAIIEALDPCEKFPSPLAIPPILELTDRE